MAPSPVDELALLDLERSNKGASKQRRDQINSEIAVMRDLLPLPESARQRLSQLQIMSLSCVFIRKCNILQKLIKNQSASSEVPCEFSQSLTGFLLVTTRDGKLVYISENVTEYLGHSMVDMKTQGDSLFDIVDKRDHGTVQAQLVHGGGEPDQDKQVSFFCRMNMSRTLKRQAGFGDVKVMHVRGRFATVPGQELGSEQQVFLAVCCPLITPDVKDNVIQNNTMVFKSVHKLDMNFIEVTQNGEFHLGMTNDEIADKSWYSCLHPEDIMEAREKHIQLIKSRHEMGTMMTVRMMTADNEIIWVNIVMHVRQALVSNSDEPVILCINQVVSEQEAYHFKLQGHLFALYAPRSPDFIFGSAFCAPIPQGIDANVLPPQAQAFVPPAYFKGQANIEAFQQPPNAHVYSPTPILSPPQNVCLRAGSPPDPNMQQGQHSNTLKALKRKLQENFTSTCKPHKISRLTQKESPSYECISSTPLPSSFGSNGYRNMLGRPMGSFQGTEIQSGGPMQIMYQQDVHHSDILQVKKQIKQSSSPKTLNKLPSMEQVVPEVRIPHCYLTPDPSPVSSPEPVIKQEAVSDQKMVDPVLIAKHLCSLKKRNINNPQPVKKSKNLPSLDVSFVDSFFDEICELTDFEFPHHSIKELPKTITVKEEPLDHFQVGCLQQQKASVPYNNIDIDDLLGLNRNDMPNSPSSCYSSEGTKESDDQRLPFCENQPSPISSIQSIDDKLSCDDVISMIAMTPESDFDGEPVDDVMDQDSWLLESCSMNGFNLLTRGNPAPVSHLKQAGSCTGEADKLYNLKQLISTWTPSGVSDSVEDSQ